MRSSWRSQAIAWAVATSTAMSPVTIESAWAQSQVGATQIVVNDVKGTVGANQPVPLRVGIDVFQDELIRTGNSSASRVVFQDRTNLSIGAGSEVKLDRFVFDPNPANSQIALSIAKGVVRFTTGSLPKSAYQITTPTATIGVRGTILTISVAADGTTMVSVDDGIAIVTGSTQTVTASAGQTTTVAPGLPPTPPGPTPPSPPMVVEMDALLASGPLPPGPAGGRAAAGIDPIYFGIAAAVAVGIALVVSGGDSRGYSSNSTGGSSSSSATGTP